MRIPFFLWQWIGKTPHKGNDLIMAGIIEGVLWSSWYPFCISKAMRYRMDKNMCAKLMWADGRCWEGTAQQIRLWLVEELTIHTKRGDMGFCPKLDLDKEGYVPEFSNFLPVKPKGTTQTGFLPAAKVYPKIQKKWYRGEKCPRCKEEHEWPIEMKFRVNSEDAEGESSSGITPRDFYIDE